MKCEKCGSKIKKDDTFCPECGKNLHKKENCINVFILKNKMKILYTLILIIIGCICFKIVSYVTSPIFIANDYMKAIINNDYSKIYNYIDLDNSSLVSESVLKEKTESLEADEYRFDSIKYYDDKVVVNYKYTKNNNIYIAKVLLQKSLNKQFIFFDKWNIVSSKVANNIKIEVPERATVLIDDVNIKDYLKKTEDGMDIYEIDEMISGKYNMKISLKNGLSVEDEIEVSSNQKFTIGKIELTKELEQNLKEQVSSVLNSLYENAKNTNPYSLTGYTNLETTYKNLTKSLQNRLFKLDNINFKGVDYISATYQNNILVLSFDIIYDYTISYNINNEVKTTTNTSSKTIYVSFVEDSNSYNIDEINGLPTTFRIIN